MIARTSPGRGRAAESWARRLLAGAFRAADADIDAGRVVHQRRPLRLPEPGRGDQPVIHRLGFRPVQGPWLVAGPGEPVAGAGDTEQNPPCGEEMIYTLSLHDALPICTPDPHLAGRLPRPWPPADAAVADLPPVPGQAHRGPEVRQPVGSAGHGHGAKPRGIEREEPDTGSSLFVSYVGPHVGLAEVGRPPGPAAACRGDPHEERHQPDPRRAAEGLGVQARRQQLLHLRRIEGPVQEGQPFPALPHDRPGHRERARSRWRAGFARRGNTLGIHPPIMAVSAPPATFAAICATGAAWLQQDDGTYALDAQRPEPPPVPTLARG